MVVSEVALFVAAMVRHELDHLQGASEATDVGNQHIGLLVLVERSDVLEEAVGQNGWGRRILDRAGNGPLDRARPFCASFRILGQLLSRVDRQRYTIEARMKGHFPNPDV